MPKLQRRSCIRASDEDRDLSPFGVQSQSYISGRFKRDVTASLLAGAVIEQYACCLFAAWHTLNGNGEMTGTTWIEESGGFGGPVMITNTHSVGVVRDAVIAWQMKKQGKTFQPWSLPIVAETWDGFLNDINGFHVKPEHVAQALDGGGGGGARPAGGPHR